jgi:hypothetical protein
MKQSRVISIFIPILLLFNLSFAQIEETISEGEDKPETTQEEKELTDEEIEDLIFEPMKGKSYLGVDYLRKIEFKEKLKSPLGAMFRSAFVPGWGQFYNGAWWKGLIFIGAESFTMFYTVKNYTKARDYYNRAMDADNEGDSEKLYYEYEQHLQKTEMWGWFFVGALVISMLDAYVDAHLSNYDVSPLEDVEISTYLKDKEMGLIISKTF